MHIPTIERRESGAAPWGSTALGPVRLEPREAPLAGIVAKGTLFTLLTLGFYRFWYKTRLRRYYWSNTTLMGDGFEYTGTGKELFIGFLIALAIVVPIYAVAAVIGLMAGPILGQIVTTAISLVLIPALVQMALYRARRYRLSRTRFRGVRFAQGGSAKQYLLLSVGWVLLVILTLGIMLPHMRTALHRYRINNTAFGSMQANFTGTAGSLMKRWLVVWLGSLVLFAVVFLASFAAVMTGSTNPGAGAAIAGFILPLWVMIGWLAYRVKEFRHFTEGTRFGAIGFSSDLRTGRVIKILVKYGFIVALLPIAFSLLALLAGGFLKSLFGGGMTPVDNFGTGATIFGIALAVLGFIFYAIITELFLRKKLWAAYLGAVSISNVSALGEILQQAGIEGGAFGEAFDTDFDIAG